jgi:hypothetical protein
MDHSRCEIERLHVLENDLDLSSEGFMRERLSTAL